MKGKGLIALIIGGLILAWLLSRKAKSVSKASPAKVPLELAKKAVASVQNGVASAKNVVGAVIQTAKGIFQRVKPTAPSAAPLDPAAEEARLQALRSEAELMGQFFDNWADPAFNVAPSAHTDESQRLGPDGDTYQATPAELDPGIVQQIDDIVAQAQADWAAANATSGIFTADESGALTMQEAPSSSVNEALAPESQASQDLVAAVASLAEAGAPGVSIDAGWGDAGLWTDNYWSPEDEAQASAPAVDTVEDISSLSYDSDMYDYSGMYD